MLRSSKNRFVKAAAAASLAAVSVAGVQVVSAGPASAAACISPSNGRYWSPTAGSANDKSPTFTTTSNCRDINLGYLSADPTGHPKGKARICFVGAGYCQSSWKTMNLSGDGKLVVATNVSDRTTYQVEIDWDSSVYGTRFEMAAWA